MDYFKVSEDAVNALVQFVGIGQTLHVLGAVPPQFPAEGVSDYDSRLRLAEYLNSHRAARGTDQKEMAERLLKSAHAFLVKHRKERLRQAQKTFNVALTLVIVGTAVVFIGAGLLLVGRAMSGSVTASAGVMSDVISALLFKMNKDANDRLDKLTAEVSKLGGLLQAFE